jgi:hypothetical protein
MTQSCEYGNELLGSKRGGEFQSLTWNRELNAEDVMGLISHAL